MPPHQGRTIAGMIRRGLYGQLTSVVNNERGGGRSARKEREACQGGRTRPTPQESVHICKVLIAHDLDRVGRHLSARCAHVGQETAKRQGIRRQSRPGAPALSLIVVALITAVLDEQQLALLGIARRCGRCLRGRCSLGRRLGRANGDRNHPHDRDYRHHLHRGWETTSTSAGSPRLTTATARAIAGPRSFGSVIGPSACTPRPWATFAKSIFGSTSSLPIWPRSIPRLCRLAIRCTCMSS